MAIVICKGTILKQTISATLTAVAQIIDMEMSGMKARTFESTTLDGGIHETLAHTGYTAPGKISGTLFYDPALAGHKFLSGLAGYVSTAPATNAMQITYADTGGTTQSFTSVGVGFGMTVAMRDGLKGKFEADITGDPGFSHP